MPELPEVETIHRSLEKILPGKTIESIDVKEEKQFFGDRQKAVGKKIANVSRKGKVLTIVLEDSLFISIHLKLTGQILFADNKDHAVFKNNIPRTGTNIMPANVTRVIFNFKDNSALFFNDMRKFGWVKLTEKMPETAAVDLLSEKFTLEYFEKALSNSRKPIKVLLLEQDKIAGIGNIYDNDSLWEAKIHPERKTNTLSKQEVEHLYNGIKKIIDEGIQYKGSSAHDEIYLMPDSEPGQYQHHFRVYHRENAPCLRCQTTIERIKQGGRSSFLCPKCQVK